MRSNKLPSVLQHPRGSISIERALKQVHSLLADYYSYASESDQDKLAASLDDIDTMLDCIDRD